MKVKIRRNYGPFPDFRQVGVLLWGDDAEYDSEGDAQHPADRNWTELYLENRLSDDPLIHIYSDDGWTIIESDDRHACLAVAVFLMEWCEMRWGDDSNLTFAQARDEVIDQYDFLTKWERAKASHWKNATRENPYPEPPDQRAR